jgi:hypothetical protein
LGWVGRGDRSIPWVSLSLSLLLLLSSAGMDDG